ARADPSCGARVVSHRRRKILPELSITSNVLRLLVAPEQFLQRLRRRFAFVKQRIDLINDRGVDLEFTRAFMSAFRSRDSFGHHLHRRRDLHKRPAATELFANAPIPAVLAETGQDEIADSTQSIKCRQLSAHWYSDPNHFGKRTRDQCRLGIIAQSETIAGPGRDCEHVLQRASQLDSCKFATGINSKSCAAKIALKPGRAFRFVASQNCCRGTS